MSIKYWAPFITTCGLLALSLSLSLSHSGQVNASTCPYNAPAGEAPSASLDMDGDSLLTASDNTIFSRYVAGLRGDALISGIIFSSAATRPTAAAIEAFIGAGCTMNAVVLPIEVIGGANTIQTVNVSLGDATGISRLWVQCHRCAYRNASGNPTNSRSGAKRSDPVEKPALPKAMVRINGGGWIALNDETAGSAGVNAADRGFGGIAGANNTVRFSVPITGARSGQNTIDFRFTETDGFTSGYRILDLNFLRNDGSQALANNNFVRIDPSLWNTQSSSASADIVAGKALWNGAVALRESPRNPEAIRASCAACHAADGRDLKFFNYSNYSIQERSKFHGLNQTQANQIASYVRSLPLAISPIARPWNPPYQPGPGLDAKPVSEWAAGAGLAAVLDSDAEMVPFLFPNGTAATQMSDVMNTGKTLNMRELPIALQLPDWNEWLPEKHPLDVVGDAFNTLPVNAGLSLNQYYEDIEMALKTENIDSLISEGWLQGDLTRFAEISTDLPTAIPLRDAAVSAGIDVNVHYLSILQWGAVKQWELMHTYGLEDKAPRMKGAYGEARSWLSDRRNVFEMAPHRIAVNQTNRPHQSVLVGKTKSTAWYQLQLTLNAGNRTAKAQLWPVDWNYQPDHIANLKSVGGPSQPVRYLASHIKMHQLYRDGRPLSSTNFGFRQTLPHRYVAGGALIDDLPTAWRTNAYAGLLNMLLDNVSVHAPSEWARGKVVGNVLEPTNFVPFVIPLNRLGADCHENNYASCWYSTIPAFRQAGVDSATLTRMIDWSASIWPAGNWNALR